MGATLVYLTFIVGVGAFVILNQISDRIKKQIELDRFTGNIIIQLRASIITIEESDQRLKIAKAAMTAGCVYVPSCPALIRAHELQKNIESKIKLIAKNHFYKQKIMWLAYQPFLSRKSSFPSFEELTHKNIELKIKLGNLISAVKTWKTHEGTPHAWKIAWLE